MCKIINVDFKKKQKEFSYTTDEAMEIVKQVDASLKDAFDGVAKLNKSPIVLNLIKDSFYKIVFNLVEVAKESN